MSSVQRATTCGGGSVKRCLNVPQAASGPELDAREAVEPRRRDFQRIKGAVVPPLLRNDGPLFVRVVREMRVTRHRVAPDWYPVR